MKDNTYRTAFVHHYVVLIPVCQGTIKDKDMSIDCKGIDNQTWRALVNNWVIIVFKEIFQSSISLFTFRRSIHLLLCTYIYFTVDSKLFDLNMFCHLTHYMYVISKLCHWQQSVVCRKMTNTYDARFSSIFPMFTTTLK